MDARILFCLALALTAHVADSAPVAVPTSRQFLPPKPGYIPVYIRRGDTPLEEINLDLAEAFKSYATKNSNHKPVEQSPNVVPEERVKSEEQIDRNEITKFDEQDSGQNYVDGINETRIEGGFSHIQKIPKKSKE